MLIENNFEGWPVKDYTQDLESGTIRPNVLQWNGMELLMVMNANQNVFISFIIINKVTIYDSCHRFLHINVVFQPHEIYDSN